MRRMVGRPSAARLTPSRPRQQREPTIKELFEASGRKGFSVVDDKKSFVWNKPKKPPAKAPEPK